MERARRECYLLPSPRVMRMPAVPKTTGFVTASKLILLCKNTAETAITRANSSVEHAPGEQPETWRPAQTARVTGRALGDTGASLWETRTCVRRRPRASRRPIAAAPFVVTAFMRSVGTPRHVWNQPRSQTAAWQAPPISACLCLLPHI